MPTRIRCLLIGLLLLAMAPLSGCEGFGQVRLKIPDYQSANVRGITIWNRDPATGEFVPCSIYKLGEIVEVDGQEYVEFRLVDERVNTRPTLNALVGRDPSNPDALTIWLPVLTNGDETILRASTFNEAGESGLSSKTIELTT